MWLRWSPYIINRRDQKPKYRRVLESVYGNMTSLDGNGGQSLSPAIDVRDAQNGPARDGDVGLSSDTSMEIRAAPAGYETKMWAFLGDTYKYKW